MDVDCIRRKKGSLKPGCLLITESEIYAAASEKAQGAAEPKKDDTVNAEYEVVDDEEKKKGK